MNSFLLFTKAYLRMPVCPVYTTCMQKNWRNLDSRRTQRDAVLIHIFSVSVYTISNFIWSDSYNSRRSYIYSICFALLLPILLHTMPKVHRKMKKKSDFFSRSNMTKSRNKRKKLVIAEMRKKLHDNYRGKWSKASNQTFIPKNSTASNAKNT